MCVQVRLKVGELIRGQGRFQHETVSGRPKDPPVRTVRPPKLTQPSPSYTWLFEPPEE